MLHREGVVNQEFVDRVVNQDYPEVSYPSEEEEEEEESE